VNHYSSSREDRATFKNYVLELATNVAHFSVYPNDIKEAMILKITHK